MFFFRKVSARNNVHTEIKYLQWQIRIQFKLSDDVVPRQKLLSLAVNKIIKHGALRWKLNGFELVEPPFRKLYSVVYSLQ